MLVQISKAKQLGIIKPLIRNYKDDTIYKNSEKIFNTDFFKWNVQAFLHSLYECQN